jgi:hypothetical protein
VQDADLDGRLGMGGYEGQTSEGGGCCEGEHFEIAAANHDEELQF